MAAKNIGIDVDGILALFDKSFTDLIINTSGKDLFPYKPYNPPCWYWTTCDGKSNGCNHEALGYTKEEDKAAWKALIASEHFWSMLPAYPDTDAVMDKLAQLECEGHAVYFITNRMGQRPKFQTETWIINRGYECPTVLVSAHKGLSAAALELDYYIDDKPENCDDVVSQMGTQCQTFILDRSWNQRYSHVPRVYSVMEMLDQVKP